MKLRQVQELLTARVLCGERLLEKKDVSSCFGCNLMSEVLATVKQQTLLCTGLTNVQVIRTANMTDLAAVVFVGGKLPKASVTEEAESWGLPLLATELPLAEACARLIQAGLASCRREAAHG